MTRVASKRNAMLGQVKDRDATVFVEERYQAPGKSDKEIESEIYKL